MKKGSKHTPEALEQISRNRRGKTAGADHPMYGKHHTAEAKEKNALAHLGKVLSDEVKKKISDSHKGKQPKNVVAGWNRGKKLSIHHRISLSLSHVGQKTGADNCNWKGGISKKNKSERQLAMETSPYRVWRLSVFERDNYTCQSCGKRGAKLHADHIKPWSTYSELRYELSNGRTLCVECHKNTDTYGYPKLLRGVTYGTI